MTEIFENEPQDWTVQFKQKKIHFVCVAAGGLTMCDFAASTLGHMKQEQEVWALTKRINTLGETGTFWPRLPLTVLPQTTWESRYSEGDESFFKKCMQDVATANRDHVKLMDMYLNLADYYGGLFRSEASRKHEIKTAIAMAKEILPIEANIENLWISA